MNGSNEFATWRARFDQWGHQIEVRWLGANGEPVLAKPASIAMRRDKIDQWGNVIEKQYFGTDDKPIASQENGGRIAVRRFTYDPRGRVLTEECFGINDEPVEDDQGAHRIAYAYNGNEVLPLQRYHSDGSWLASAQ